MNKTKRFVLAIVAAILAFPVVADAQERKSPLAGAPAIRHRLELRDKRFEIGAGMGASLGQDFYHAIFVNARLGFHLTDWLAIAGAVGHNLTPGFETSFHQKLMERLPVMKGTDRTPTQADALAGMNRIGQIVAVQAEVVPFTGKFMLFSRLFMNYDFYAFGGPGFINFTAATPCPAGGSAPSCAVTGFKVGANFGVGMHAFIKDYLAINVEVRDLLVRNNPAGRDEGGDGVADDHDLSWDSNYILTVNAMFFLPQKAAISH